MSTKWCPKCHQPIRHERAGVFMGPTKVALFDMLHAAGEIGMSSEEIGYRLDQLEAGKNNRNSIKANMYQLRELLEGSEYRVMTDRRCPRHWSLVKRTQQRPAA